MNYFSHFFVDGIDNQHEYNTGLLLPDITRGNIKSFRHLKLFTSASSQNFFNGCAAHYLADKKFHASEFFRNILQQSSLIINQAKFNSDLNRKWFLAHILAELMLDRILVRMYPEMLHKFYNSLDSINDSDLAYYLTLYGMKDVEEFVDKLLEYTRALYG